MQRGICALVDKGNNWSLTICIPQGNDILDISCAAQGSSSITPIVATNHPKVYPRGKSASLYQFDTSLYGKISFIDLKKMLIKVGCFSGSTLELHQ
jgi:hypothetical protein